MSSGGSQCGSRCSSDKMCPEQSQAGDNSLPGLQTHRAGGGTCSPLQLLRAKTGTEGPVLPRAPILTQE